MVTLLCLIGLVASIWGLGKFFTRLGDTLIEMDRRKREARYSKLMSQASTPPVITTQTDARTVIKNTREQIQNIRGKSTDEDFNDRVRREIEELTGVR